VLIPTLAERREQLHRTVAGYRRTVPGCEVLWTSAFDSVFEGWGAGCNYLARYAKGDVLLMASDDAEPRWGWYEAGLAALRRGMMPRARLYEQGNDSNPRFDQAPDWAPLDFSCFIFLPRPLYDRVGPVQASTWYVDVEYSQRLQAAGVPVVARTGFDWDHRNMPRRWYRSELEPEYMKAAGL
jgi:hypothetical protein